MSRCVSCDDAIDYFYTNRLSNKEEDMCTSCRNKARDISPIRDYAFLKERQGLKLLPVDYYDSVK